MNITTLDANYRTERARIAQAAEVDLHDVMNGARVANVLKDGKPHTIAELCKRLELSKPKVYAAIAYYKTRRKLWHIRRPAAVQLAGETVRKL